MKHTFYIQSFPVPFHDILEVRDFLLSLSPTLLYMFYGQIVYCDGVPIFRILLYYRDGVNLITYSAWR